MSSDRPRVFLDVNIGDTPAGRLTIELFVDQTPRACENFRQICNGFNGLSYAQCAFHRVIDEFMVQCGDLVESKTISIYGGEFDDENLNWRKIDAPGLVCCANRGRDTNGSQFFITLEPCPHLDGKHVVFGRLISGEDALHRIARVPVDKNDRPRIPVLISRCGELEKRSKNGKARGQTDRDRQSDSRDRGRPRKSDPAGNKAHATGHAHASHPHRRQSDNVVDEGIRGRSRQRSRTRSTSRALASSTESEVSSTTRKLKRKRGASPSRQAGNGSNVRRRRSLPNQYAEAGASATARGDEERYRTSSHHDQSPRGYNDHERKHREHRDIDRYKPSRPRDRYGADKYGTRLEHHASEEREPPVKFKGRGVMKYREH